MRPFTTLADLLRQLSTAPGPCLTWYGTERIELSGAVLANWVIKTTNLLVEEFDAGPGMRIAIDLPVHWRTAVWALATWRSGATVALGESADADIVVTHRPQHYTDPSTDVIAVALPALARAFEGTLPPRATDAAAAVMTYPDRLGWVPETDPAEIALDGDRDVPALTYEELFGLGAEPAQRVLIDGRLGLRKALLGGIKVWQSGGSVVLIDPEVGDALDIDPMRRERLLASERVGS